MAKKIHTVGKALKRIKVTGAALARIEPEEFAAALGAEPVGERHCGRLDLISLGQLGSELLKRLRSTGGRPAIEGATERCKVPLSPEEVAKLEEIVLAIEAETGSRPALGQIAGLILSIHLDSVVGSGKKPAAKTAKARSFRS